MTEYERGFIDGVKSKVEAELTPTIIKMTDGLSQTIQEAVKTVIGNVKITAHEPASSAKWVLFAKDCVGRAFYCSNCRKVTTTEDFENSPLEREEYYCSRCGARMDGDTECHDTK